MSGISDIRMYVEHLFEGRTLDAETIELKEEIYGNLVARYEDYLAQGMGEAEAYHRTCEAVTSVEDMLGGERDARSAASAEAGATEIRAGAVPAPGGAGAPPAPGSTAEQGAPERRRWSTGKVVAAVAGGFVIVALLGALGFGALFGVTPPSQTSVDSVTTIVDDPSAQAEPQTTSPDEGQTTQTDETAQESTPQNGTGSRYGAPEGSGTGLTAEVEAVSADSLAAYAGTAVTDAARIEELARTLPVGDYLLGVSGAEGSGTVVLSYQYESRDLLARDDDHVDRALVFDAAAIMCAVDGLDALYVEEVEDDGRDYDRDLHVFERSTMEQGLGVTLDSGQLTADAWPALRDQLMTERVWDRLWDRADRD